jgi:dTDP-4-amino-4,6-dideoxygalactose transaminase
VQRELTALGVQTGIHYPVPCHLQDPYRRFAAGPLPVSEAAADEVLSLPMFPHMTDEQVDAVCNAVQEALSSKEADIA